MIIQWSAYILISLASAIFFEFVAWFMHKYVMHGFGWFLHEDHHRPRHKLQKNDAYALFFSRYHVSQADQAAAVPAQKPVHEADNQRQQDASLNGHQRGGGILQFFVRAEKIRSRQGYQKRVIYIKDAGPPQSRVTGFICLCRQLAGLACVGVGPVPFHGTPPRPTGFLRSV
jgi:hypothetical protein